MSRPTFQEVAAIASELTGRTITLAVVEPDEWVATQTAARRPEPMLRFTLGIYEAAQRGYFAGVDPLLGHLLGREPRTVRDLLAEQATH